MKPMWRDRTGFTLIEVVVSLVLMGVLAGFFLSLVGSQQRFARQQTGRQEAGRSVRSALDRIANELRAVPPGAIREASANRIAYRLPRLWAVVCNDLAPGSGQAWLVYQRGGWPTDLPLSVANEPGWGLALPAALVGSWQDATPGTASSGGTPSCSGEASLAESELFEVRSVTYSGLSDPVGAGASVFFYEDVVYDAAPHAPFGPNAVWVRRSTRAGLMNPLAGPLGPSAGDPAAQGLVFGYRCRNGLVMTPPGTLPTGWSALVGVEVRVVGRGRASASGVRQEVVDSMQVRLRNAAGGVDCVL